MQPIPQTQRQKELGIQSYWEKDETTGKWIIKMQRTQSMELNSASEVPTKEKFLENKNWFQVNLQKAILSFFEKRKSP